MKKTMEVPINDLLGFFAFLVTLNHPKARLEEDEGRAYGLCEADELFYDLAQRFHRNDLIPVQDFLRAQREIKSKMLALKNGGR